MNYTSLLSVLTVGVGLIMSMVLISGCAQQQQSIESKNGILQGKVTIGPLCPVEPCNLPPERIAKAYENRKFLIYEQPTKIKIAEVNLDANGYYSVPLKAGTYIVDITDATGKELPLEGLRSFLGNVIPKEIEVKVGETVVADFDIDTGIR